MNPLKLNDITADYLDYNIVYDTILNFTLWPIALEGVID